MNALTHDSDDGICDLIATLEGFAEAGIDPAFDGECQELERHYAEIRLQFCNVN